MESLSGMQCSQRADFRPDNSVSAIHVAVARGYIPNWLARAAKWTTAPVLADTCATQCCAAALAALREAQDGPSPARLQFMLGCDAPTDLLSPEFQGDAVSRLGSSSAVPVWHYRQRPPPIAPMLVFTDALRDERLMGLNNQFISDHHEACIVADLGKARMLCLDGAGQGLLDRAFGTERWRGLAADASQLPTALAKLYADQLRLRGAAFAPYGHMLDLYGDYLATVFLATGNINGCAGFKDALWSVQSHSSLSVVDDACNRMAEESFDRHRLADELRALTAPGEWVTVEVLDRHLRSDHSAYRQSQLRRRTLRALEEEGALRVRRPAGARSGTFPAGTSVLF